MAPQRVGRVEENSAGYEEGDHHDGSEHPRQKAQKALHCIENIFYPLVA